MIQISSKAPIFSFLALPLLVFQSPAAHAYLDPSTGSMIVSALVGIIASIALAVKTYWYKLKNLIRRNVNAPEAKDTSPDK